MSGVVDLSLIEATDAFSGTLDLNPIAASVHALGARIAAQRRSVGCPKPRGRESGDGDQSNETAWLHWELEPSAQLLVSFDLTWNDSSSDRQGVLDNPGFAVGALADDRHFTSLAITNQWQWYNLDDVDIEAGWTVARQRSDFSSTFNAEYGSLAEPIQGRSAAALTLRTEPNRNMQWFVDVGRYTQQQQLHEV